MKLFLITLITVAFLLINIVYAAPPNICDMDGDGYISMQYGCGGNDCDDTIAWVHPGATEICGNYIDENCDGNQPACTFLRTFYVDGPGGSGLQSGCSDNYAGTNINQPWCTLAKAGDTAKAGDQVLIRGGTYNLQEFRPKNSGTAANPVMFKAYNSEMVRLWNPSGNSGAIINVRVSYIIFEGPFYMQQFDTDHVYYSVLNNAELEGHTVNHGDNYDGVRVDWSKYNVFRNLNIHGFRASPGYHQGNACGVKFYDSEDNVFEYNYLWDNNRAFYEKSHTKNNVLRRSILADGHESCYQTGGHPPGIGAKVYENIFSNCKVAVKFNTGTGDGIGQTYDNYIFNNVFYKLRPVSYSGRIDDGAMSHQNYLWNNIYHELEYSNMAYKQSFRPIPELLDYQDYNLFSPNFHARYGDDPYGEYGSPADAVEYTSLQQFWAAVNPKREEHSLEVASTTATFMNPGNLDFHLKSTSAARNAGYYGQDMGAYPRRDNTIIGLATGTTAPPACSCTSWTNNVCGGGSCTAAQMRQTRTCTPTNCDVAERCVAHESCSVAYTVEPICPGGSNPRPDVIFCSDFEKYNDPVCISDPMSSACYTANGWNGGGFGGLGGGIRFDENAAVGSGIAKGNGRVGANTIGYSKYHFTPQSGISYRFYVKYSNGYLGYNGPHGPGIMGEGDGACSWGGTLEMSQYQPFLYSKPDYCVSPSTGNIYGSGVSLKNNRWYLFEQQRVVDTQCTDPTSPTGCNGIFRLWIDGNLVIERTNLNQGGVNDNLRWNSVWGPRLYFHNRLPNTGEKGISYDNFVISNKVNCGSDGRTPCIGPAVNENPRGTPSGGPYFVYEGIEPFALNPAYPGSGCPTRTPAGDCVSNCGGTRYGSSIGSLWGPSTGTTTFQSTIQHGLFLDQCSNPLPDGAMKVALSGGATAGGIKFERNGNSHWRHQVVNGWIYFPSGNDYSTNPALAGFSSYAGFKAGKYLAMTVNNGKFALVRKTSGTASPAVFKTSNVAMQTGKWHNFEIMVSRDSTVSLMIDGVAVVSHEPHGMGSGWFYNDTITTGPSYLHAGVISYSDSEPFTVYYDDLQVGTVSFYSCEGWEGYCPWTQQGCSCTGWTNDVCGGGSCTAAQMRQMRSCSPGGCDVVERCVSDVSCDVQTPSESVYLWVEAEDFSSILPPFQVSVSSEASGGRFIQVPEGQGTYSAYATYAFTVPVAGDYIVWFRVKAQGPTSDSFVVSVDNGAEYLYEPYKYPDVACDARWLSWGWDKVSDRVSGGGCPPGLDPVVFSLNAGQHVFKVKERDDGTQLDRILVTNVLTYVPTGMGGPSCMDSDGDGYFPISCGGTDCNDNNAAINPGASEICGNGVDENCDTIDLTCPICPQGQITFRCKCGDSNQETGYCCENQWQLGECPVACPDNDNDGYTDLTCGGTDCNDANPLIHPGAPELCNQIDDNCNGIIDDANDVDQDGFNVCNGDCDDTNSSINPSAAEKCNFIDDDCDSLTDEGFDADADGYTTCEGDCNDGNPNINPGANEICGNTIDENCDGIAEQCGPSCGNGIVETGETCSSCPQDVICADNELCCSSTCVEPTCFVDADCDDNNPNTRDMCKKGGQCNAFCQHKPGKPKLFIKTQNVVEEGKTFVAKVVDDNNNPVSGSTVQYQGETKLTDEKGEVSFVARANYADISAIKDLFESTFARIELINLPDDVCGDNICGSNENEVSCSLDCLSSGKPVPVLFVEVPENAVVGETFEIIVRDAKGTIVPFAEVIYGSQTTKTNIFGVAEFVGQADARYVLAQDYGYKSDLKFVTPIVGQGFGLPIPTSTLIIIVAAILIFAFAHVVIGRIK